MPRSFALRLVLTVLATSAVLPAQPAPSRVFPPPAPEPQPQQQPTQPQATPQQPGAPGQPGQPPAAQQNVQVTDAPRLTDSGAFIMPNASLTEMIDLLAKRLKINYILDPAVRGTVSIFTSGEG